MTSSLTNKKRYYTLGPMVCYSRNAIHQWLVTLLKNTRLDSECRHPDDSHAVLYSLLARHRVVPKDTSDIYFIVDLDWLEQKQLCYVVASMQTSLDLEPIVRTIQTDMKHKASVLDAAHNLIAHHGITRDETNQRLTAFLQGREILHIAVRDGRFLDRQLSQDIQTHLRGQFL